MPTGPKKLMFHYTTLVIIRNREKVFGMLVLGREARSAHNSRRLIDAEGRVRATEAIGAELPWGMFLKDQRFVFRWLSKGSLCVYLALINVSDKHF